MESGILNAPLVMSVFIKTDQSQATFTSAAVQNNIYAFGVVLWEILMGMNVYDKWSPLGKHKLMEWATPFLEDEDNLGMIMDKQLQMTIVLQMEHSSLLN
ncbi:hypothetical protein LXL04_006908 [Taraxacum kok-saghyz]